MSDDESGRGEPDEDQAPEEPDNHYGDLRGVRMALIDDHQRLKAKANDEDGPEDAAWHHTKGKADGVLEGIQQVESLLREWNDRDDRDGAD